MPKTKGLNTKLFKGLRVIDLSWGWAGPICTDLFALMGAEVIKVESMKKLDFSRLLKDPMTHAFLGVNHVNTFNDVNLNKKSIRINMKLPEGVGLIRRLVQVSDVLLESFSAGAIDRLGLDYESVRKINPRIVMASTSTNGRTGPEVGYLGYASLFAASSGLGAMTGYKDGPPSEIRATVDAVSAYRLFVSVTSALIHRQRTGEGQYIDYSSQEAISCLIGDSIMDYFANGHVQSRNGNEDLVSPHNLYRCKGKDKWISIAVNTDGEWQALSKAIGRPAWTKQARFADMYSRRQNAGDLDKLIESWTCQYSDYEIMETLQKAGVAAVPSFDAEELFSDPHLNERAMYRLVQHPQRGTRMVIMTCPWKFSATPVEIEHDAPFIGEHTQQVLSDILSMSPDQIKVLEEKGVLD